MICFDHRPIQHMDGCPPWCENCNLTTEFEVPTPIKQERPTDAEIKEIDRTARAYGWEVGHGQPLVPVLEFSPENPFIHPDWRKDLRYDYAPE